MALEVYTYTPSDVYLIFAGYTAIGWDKITIERSSPVFRHIQGIRGKHTRVRDDDTSCTITLSVMQTSPANEYLSEILALDNKNGTGRMEVSLKDTSGNSKFYSVEAYITGYPSTSFSEDIEYRSWTIFCQTTEYFHVGGNEKPSGSLIKEALRLFE